VSIRAPVNVEIFVAVSNSGSIIAVSK